MEELKSCVLFSTADWDTPYWTNKQHTAVHLVKNGYQVLYVESIGIRPPKVNKSDLSRILNRLKSGFSSPKQVDKNLWVLSPLALPFKQHWKLMKLLNQGWLGLRIKFFMWRKSFNKPLIWTYHPYLLQVIHFFEHGSLVYHCVDDLSSIPGVDASSFNKEEEYLLGLSKVVFATNRVLVEKCIKYNLNTHYFPNVADREHFGKAIQAGNLPSDIKDIPTPIIGYIGVLSDFKVDFSLIYQVAISRPDWHWVIIGDEREGQRSEWIVKLKELSNLHFLGHREYKDLPDYLRGMDVATLPTLLNEYTKSMFPMKYYEYLAAGVPVVSVPLEFTKIHTEGLMIATNAKEFECAIAKQLENGKFSREQTDIFVGDNTWADRLSKMLALL